MKAALQEVEQAAVLQHCKALRLPVVAAQFAPLAEQAQREKQGPVRYLEALLAQEVDERERHCVERRVQEARLPRMKTLEEFDFNQAPGVDAARMRDLATGGYIERTEPVVLLGESGTGKTHLATALCVAACRQRRRVRFITAANLITELVEARQQNALRRALISCMSLPAYSIAIPFGLAATAASSNEIMSASLPVPAGASYLTVAPKSLPACSAPCCTACQNACCWVNPTI